MNFRRLDPPGNLVFSLKFLLFKFFVFMKLKGFMIDELVKSLLLRKTNLFILLNYLL